MVELRVLGTGDAFSVRRFGTCFLLSAGRAHVLIDGPPGLFRLLEAQGLDRRNIDTVLLTHIHEDHAGGIETLLLWRRFEMGVKTRLFTSARVFRAVKERLFATFEETFGPELKEIRRGRLEDYVDFCELAEEGVTPLLPGVETEIRHNWHPTPTLGLRLGVAPIRIGISGDTCFRLALLDELLREGRIGPDRHAKLAGNWLWECDLIYHEASQRALSHTLEADLLQLPEPTRDKLRLIHLSDDFQPGALATAAEGERVVVTEKGLAVSGPCP